VPSYTFGLAGIDAVTSRFEMFAVVEAVGLVSW
jgi:hypothetical protein